jgi:hypothetical protein
MRSYLVKITLCVTLLCSCDGGDSNKDSDDSDPAPNSSPTTETTTPAGALNIKGTLSNGDDAANTDILAARNVVVRNSLGDSVGEAITDEDGNYSISLAAGALGIVGKDPSEEENTELTLNGSYTLTKSFSKQAYFLESSIEDDGAGKALGYKEEISLTQADIISTEDDVGTIDLGTNALVEIGAITGTIKYTDALIDSAGTDVFIPGKSFFVRTGADGKFHILFVPAGTYNIRVEKDSFSRDIEVVVASNKTSSAGDITLGRSDRNPGPIDETLLGTWSVVCNPGTDPTSPLTGVVTITTLTGITTTSGDSCLTASTESGASARQVNAITVLSDSAFYVTYEIIDTGVKNYINWQVISYTSNKITISNGSDIEVLTRQ